MTKFREHRGSLAYSMTTVVEVSDYDELLAHCRNILAPRSITELKIEPYFGLDKRIGWDTYIVTIPKFGVIGFTDGPLERKAV